MTEVVCGGCLMFFRDVFSVRITGDRITFGDWFRQILLFLVVFFIIFVLLDGVLSDFSLPSY